MNGQKDHFLKEARRHLELALIGATRRVRELVELAIEDLKKYEEQEKK